MQQIMRLKALIIC